MFGTFAATSGALASQHDVSALERDTTTQPHWSPALRPSAVHASDLTYPPRLVADGSSALTYASRKAAGPPASPDGCPAARRGRIVKSAGHIANPRGMYVRVDGGLATSREFACNAASIQTNVPRYGKTIPIGIRRPPFALGAGNPGDAKSATRGQHAPHGSPENSARCRGKTSRTADLGARCGGRSVSRIR